MITVYLADIYHDYQPTRQYVPLGIGYIGSYLKSQFGSDVDVQLFKSVDKFIDSIKARRPDLIGMTNYTWNNGLNNFAGKLIKEIEGDIPIVMGGPNIRLNEPDVARFLADRSYVDRYVLFGGEGPMAEIVREFMALPLERRNGQGLRQIKTMTSYAMVDGTLVGGTENSGETDLDFVPSPYLNGMLDEFLDNKCLPIVETNRGCPYSCTYCVWGVSAQSKIKTFSLARVNEELEYITGSGWEFSDIVFADANFGLLKRDVDIARHLKSLHGKYGSFQSVTVFWAKNAQPHIVDIGKNLGKLTNTYVAFQSLDPDVLNAVKRKNIDTGKLLYLINELKPHTHSAQTDILVGLPNENYDSHLRSLEGVLRYGINRIMGGEIRLLPGSEIETEESREKYKIRSKYRLCEGQYGVYRGKFVYELEEVIRQTAAMTEDDMLRLRVLRAIFYASVTIGEQRPIISYLVKKGISVIEFFRSLSELNPAYPDFDKTLLWAKKTAVDEWFATQEEAEKRLAIRENVETLLGAGASMKLNYGLLGRLLCRPDEYRGFLKKTRDILADIVRDEAPEVISEIVEFCSARNYIHQALADGGAVLRQAAVSRKTQKILVSAGYLDPGNLSSTDEGVIELNMPAVTEKMINEHLVEFKKSPSILKMSQLLQRFSGRTYLEPPNTKEL
ncbi:MAG: cobalamin-dependent protein [Nitrospinae bacterium]|nr:cobalamin-dependent protein [Nitrospinota bacterium]MBF0633904.1 cobalamin-dependent protein [Nitrospinota bacterium]